MRAECYFIPLVMLVSSPVRSEAASRTHTSHPELGETADCYRYCLDYVFLGVHVEH